MNTDTPRTDGKIITTKFNLAFGLIVMWLNGLLIGFYIASYLLQ